MDDFLDLLYGSYIVPRVEDDATIQCAAELYRNLPQPHADRCERLLQKYALRAFLLGVRTGVGLGV